jgi:hypothetical protein
MSEFSISSEALQKLYDQKVQEQKEKEDNYFALEFPEELSSFDFEGKLEESLSNQIDEAVITIELLPFQQQTKEKLTALLLRYKNTLFNLGTTEGLNTKINTIKQSVKFLRSFEKSQTQNKEKVLGLIMLFRKIEQFFINHL